MSNVFAAILTPNVVGLLDRTVAVALAEISRGGCLLETSSAVTPGTVATLSVVIQGTTYTDYVRVARCTNVRGAGERHHLGVEFLPLERPAPHSLRLYAASLAVEPASFSGTVRVGFETT